MQFLHLHLRQNAKSLISATAKNPSRNIMYRKTLKKYLLTTPTKIFLWTKYIYIYILSSVPPNFNPKPILPSTTTIYYIRYSKLDFSLNKSDRFSKNVLHFLNEKTHINAVYLQSTTVDDKKIVALYCVLIPRENKQKENKWDLDTTKNKTNAILVPALGVVYF